MLRLEGTLNRNGEVVRLDSSELGELDTELAQMSKGDLLVELLGQDVDTNGPLLGLGPEGDLGKDLVGEGVGHDERGVAGGTAKVDKTTLGKEDDVAAGGHGEAVDLGLDVDALNGVGLEPGNVDLNVEVTNVADNSIVLHGGEVGTGDDVTAASGGDEDLGLSNSLLHGGDLVTLHSSLESVDGVDLGDKDTRAESAEGSSATLTDITVTSDNGHLTGDHDVGGTLDTVDERLTAAVQVVELGLGDRVVDVDGGQLEGAVLHHLVQVVDTGGGLLRETLDAGKKLGVLLVDDVGEVTTVVEDHVEGLTVGELEGLLNAPDELLIGLTLPGVHGHTGGGNGSSGVVLGGEAIGKIE